MKILFLSAFNLTTNPRLAKELRFALDLGYTVDVLGIDLGGWSAEIDSRLLPSLETRKTTFLPVTRRPLHKWLVWTLAEKTARLLWPITRENNAVSTLAHSRRSLILWRHLRSQKTDYDLVIAHTLPTLYPAWRLSRTTGIPFIFDVEDYHPGEKCSESERHRRELLMCRLLPHAAFITCASPMICEHTHKLIPGYPENRMMVINNSFPTGEFSFTPSQEGKIQFVWFSQNIAARRGLEIILPVLYQYKDRVQLTLIGNLYQDFYNSYLVQFKDILAIKPPMPQRELNMELCKYDVGLALELNSADFNRQICLTNKIFAYAQAGLFILATDTPAQKRFINENEILGTVAPQTHGAMNIALQDIINNIGQIRSQKRQRFTYAQRLSWDREKEKLRRIWALFQE